MKFLFKKNNYLPACFFIAFISFLIVLTLTPNGVGTTPDSLNYIYAAKSFSINGEFRVPNFVFEVDAYEKPMTAWPPLYPTFLYSFLSDNNPEKSIRLFNCIALSALGILFMFIIIRTNVLLGVLGAFILLLQIPILTIYTYAWSETLFLPLIIGAYYFAAAYCSEGVKWKLLISISLIIAASYTRYIGIVFIFPFICMILLSSLSYKEKRYASIIVGVLISLAFLPIIIRNIIISDEVGGVVRESTARDLLSNINDFGDLLAYHLLGLWNGVFFTIFACSLMGLVAWINKKHNKQGSDGVLPIFYWPLCWGFIYTITLIILRSWKEFDVLDTS